MADVSTKVLFEAEKGVQAKVNREHLAPVINLQPGVLWPAHRAVTRAEAEGHETTFHWIAIRSIEASQHVLRQCSAVTDVAWLALE
ncbi:hypothetical protein EYF80_047976 [Liparis tanakae]|uniref:Uncharacterized protein n=1 Tax=Liparis tanakae TaxID=230148 RepID=A0A4Z2FLD6_9TELE|nr:hypothetical protein EYF80_047976 [Liparis tanakae]